jgi:hypothetical protein
MTMLIAGTKPATKRGKEFWRTNIGWHELATYCIAVTPEICAACKEWREGGDGLDHAHAVALADALQAEIDAGRTAAYAASQYPDDVPRRDGLLFDEEPCHLHPLVANVTAFIAFLRECGGFEICW